MIASLDTWTLPHLSMVAVSRTTARTFIYRPDSWYNRVSALCDVFVILARDSLARLPSFDKKPFCSLLYTHPFWSCNRFPTSASPMRKYKTMSCKLAAERGGAPLWACTPISCTSWAKVSLHCFFTQECVLLFRMLHLLSVDASQSVTLQINFEHFNRYLTCVVINLVYIVILNANLLLQI